MRAIAVTLFLLLTAGCAAQAAVTLAVSEKAGKSVREQSQQLGKRISSGLGTDVDVVTLADDGEVEAWLNRYATADLALVTAGFVAGRPGRFIIIGPVGHDLMLVGRNGIGGNLPERITRLLEKEGQVRVSATPPPVPAAAAGTTGSSRQAVRGDAPARRDGIPVSPAKSVNEDRYFVTYVYRERLNRDPDAAHLDYWTEQLQSGAVTKQQLFEVSCDLDKMSCENR